MTNSWEIVISQYGVRVDVGLGQSSGVFLTNNLDLNPMLVFAAILLDLLSDLVSL